MIVAAHSAFTRLNAVAKSDFASSTGAVNWDIRPRTEGRASSVRDQDRLGQCVSIVHPGERRMGGLPYSACCWEVG